jgi:periplasmic mercuric ion binding protein
MIRLFMIVWVMSFSGVAFAAPQSIAISVATMVCGPDPHNIKQALQAVPGVMDVQISLEKRTALVSFDNEKSSVDALLKAVASVGYAAIVPPKP